ncbi:CCA tRNA nucleotidyltransferase [Aerococcaceae bacterium 50-4]
MTNGQEFTKAAPIIHTLNEAGYEAYFVGGAVRDLLLDLPIHDVDIATSAYPAEVQGLFPRHFDVGLDHGTIMVWFEGETYEITTFRTESTYQDYRRPDKVTFVQNLEEDLLRRDFTINALAMNTNHEIIDYFDGQKDLANQVIRAVGNAQDRFNEDGLRMMRGVRFASQLDFKIAEDTQEAIADNASILVHIAVERIAVEMNKLWIGVNWHKGLNAFLDTNLIDYVPVLTEYKSVFKDLLDQTSDQVQLPNENLAWALLFWRAYDLADQKDLAKIEQAVRQFVKAWKMSNQAQKDILAYLDILVYRANHQEWTLIDLYGRDQDQVLLVEGFIRAQQLAGQAFYQETFKTTNISGIHQLFDQLPIRSLRDLAINGQDIMTEINPENKRTIGQMLKFLEQAVVAEKVANERVPLLAYINNHYQI